MHKVANKTKAFMSVLAGAVALAGCTSSASSVKPTFVSESKYAHYSCPMINADLQRVSQQAMELAGEQDANATADAVIMGAGLILFWPALIGLAFTEDQKEELAALRGEKEALERAAIRKRC